MLARVKNRCTFTTPKRAAPFGKRKQNKRKRTQTQWQKY